MECRARRRGRGSHPALPQVAPRAAPGGRHPLRRGARHRDGHQAAPGARRRDDADRRGGRPHPPGRRARPQLAPGPAQAARGRGGLTPVRQRAHPGHLLRAARRHHAPRGLDRPFRPAQHGVHRPAGRPARARGAGAGRPARFPPGRRHAPRPRAAAARPPPERRLPGLHQRGGRWPRRATASAGACAGSPTATTRNGRPGSGAARPPVGGWFEASSRADPRYGRSRSTRRSSTMRSVPPS